jgi:hypothetical protein
LAGGTFRGLIWKVVGVGIVIVLHKPHYDGSQPRNPSALDLTSTPYQSAAQRLSAKSRGAPSGISFSISFQHLCNRAGGRTFNVRQRKSNQPKPSFS